MENGIEIRITTPPILISFTPINSPIREIAPILTNKMGRRTAEIEILLPRMRYIAIPIPLRINPGFFLKFVSSFFNSVAIPLLSLSSNTFFL